MVQSDNSSFLGNLFMGTGGVFIGMIVVGLMGRPPGTDVYSWGVVALLGALAYGVGRVLSHLRAG